MTSFIIAAVMVTVFIVLLALSFLLASLDKKVDYSQKKITPLLENDASDCVLFRYSFLYWQFAKIKYINENYSDTITYDNKLYTVIAKFNEKKHQPTETDILPSILYRDIVFKVKLFSEIRSQSIINNTQIVGNSNTVTINQSIENNIEDAIENVLHQNIDENDKLQLELFKYKLRANESTKSDADKIITVLSKYVPYISFATALINIIKSTFL